MRGATRTFALADAAASGGWDKAIIASHHEAFDEIGTDVGTPVIRIRARTDGFFELKRSRNRPPSFD
jgi:hypothetical protein